MSKEYQTKLQERLTRTRAIEQWYFKNFHEKKIDLNTYFGGKMTSCRSGKNDSMRGNP